MRPQFIGPLLIGAFFIFGGNVCAASQEVNLNPDDSSCLASGVARTITLCEPQGGTTLTSPMHVSAAATSGLNPVKVIQVYVDGIKRYERGNSTSLEADIVIPTGTRRVTVQALDDMGAFKSTVYVTVTGQTPMCAPPGADRAVNICAPPAGSTSPPSVHISAAANEGSSPIKVMQVYVDGVKRFEKANTSTLEEDVAMAAGIRRVTVQAIDALGAFKQTVFITVTSGSACSPAGSSCNPNFPCCPGLTCRPASVRATCEH